MFSLLEFRKFQRNFFPHPSEPRLQKSLSETTFTLLPQDKIFCTKGVFTLLNNCHWVLPRTLSLGPKCFPGRGRKLCTPLCNSFVQTLGSTHRWTLLLWTICHCPGFKELLALLGVSLNYRSLYINIYIILKKGAVTVSFGLEVVCVVCKGFVFVRLFVLFCKATTFLTGGR